jgi:DNA-directed RNA polymerase specialized sigma24 family protein
MDRQGSDDPIEQSVRAAFETTRWNIVLTAREPCAPEARAALAALCAAYWYPLYAFVRRKGHGPDAAQDLVQGFFAQLLEKESLRAVDPAKGRFRSFLMAACSHYIANRRDHDRAQKRGGGFVHVSPDSWDAEGRYGQEPAHSMTAEWLFNRRWALTLLDRVVARLEAEAAAAGRAEIFSRLKTCLTGERAAAHYAEVARDLGMTEAAIKMAAHRLRKRYQEALREEIARTVDDPSEVDEEIHDLFAALGG